MGDHRINNAPLIRFRVYNISIMLTESEGGVGEGVGVGREKAGWEGNFTPVSWCLREVESHVKIQALQARCSNPPS